LKWLLVAAAAIVVLAIAAVVSLPYVVDTPRVQALIATSASQAVGRPVHFSGIAVRALPLPAVELKELEIADDPKFGSAPFLKLQKGTLRLGLRALLGGRIEITQVILTQPSIALIEDAQGHWNIASLGAGADTRSATPRSGRGGSAPGGGAGGSPAAAAAVLGSTVKIEKGFVTYSTRTGGAGARYRVEDLNLTLKGGSTQIELEGDLRVKPGDLLVKISKGTLALPPTRGPIFDAPVHARLTLQGTDVGELVAATIGPEPGVAGPLAGTLAITGTLSAPRAVGDVELSSLKVTETRATCAEPKQRSLSLAGLTLAARWEGDRFLARPLNTTLGRGTITTNVTVTFERGTRMELADLVLKTVPLDKVLVDFLCEGYAVTGPLDLTGTLSMRGKEMLKTLSGSGRLAIGPGKVVGAQALALLDGVVRAGGTLSSLLAGDVPTASPASPLEFDSITATYQIVDGVATTKDLLYTSRAMKVGVSGQYALATGAMNLDVMVSHGRGQLAAKLTGTSSSPSIRLAPASLARDLDADKVQRGLQDLLKRFR
jgi:hypothetical protein